MVHSGIKYLGGHSDLCCGMVACSHEKMSVQERQRIGVTDSLLRLSIGLEDADDLKQDIDNALKKSGL